MHRSILSFALLGAAAFLPDQVLAQASSTSATPVRTAPVSSSSRPSGPDLVRMPMASPELFDRAARRAGQVRPRGAPGAKGDSAAGAAEAPSDGEAPQAFGSSTAPYTTARVAVTTLGDSSTAKLTPVTSYPYRATGKIRARFEASSGLPAGWYICTASLVKKGVLITAAHCVHNYGQGDAGFATEVEWYPSNISDPELNAQPFGVYTHRQIRIPTVYRNGTDTCQLAGVVCNNDIATIVLNKRDGAFPGDSLGAYGYGWNGFSYVESTFLGNVFSVQITQLGYPKAFDKGFQMQRTDAVGWYTDAGFTDLQNTQIGSAQTGGSSGGPWLVNFGTRPSVSSAASRGSANDSNIVVGVTSYGSTTKGFNRQGSSYFGQNKEFPGADYDGHGAGNIGKIIRDTCTFQAAYC